MILEYLVILYATKLEMPVVALRGDCSVVAILVSYTGFVLKIMSKALGWMNVLYL